ncbi:glutamine synthetase [Sesbania bispinosa]|nr:glutamine synthetase [Sesbania bispinosa]
MCVDVVSVFGAPPSTIAERLFHYTTIPDRTTIVVATMAVVASVVAVIISGPPRAPRGVQNPAYKRNITQRK